MLEKVEAREKNLEKEREKSREDEKRRKCTLFPFIPGSSASLANLSFSQRPDVPLLSQRTREEQAGKRKTRKVKDVRRKEVFLETERMKGETYINIYEYIHTYRHTQSFDGSVPASSNPFLRAIGKV